MTNNMRDRLVKLLLDPIVLPIHRPSDFKKTVAIAYANHLIENGVVLDTNIIQSENRQPIQTFAEMPMNEVLDIVQAKNEARIIVPPCKVGDNIYYKLGKNASVPFGHSRILTLTVEAIATTKDKEGWFVRTNFLGTTADFQFIDFGKRVFLTYEEAEQALKKR